MSQNEIESITIVFRDRTVVVLDVASTRVISPSMVEQIQTAVENAGVRDNINV
ncbi:hypothetical protein [Leptospira borgpetersenii]|uniref:hypothetical protein n=1 Tax=Leptospira borgpetersenii TaxID=174 RepID=UPI00034AF18D|nr:hypothetical protein [Leptospira borgpetersenii]URD71581.1 hypothetical protein LIX26_16530 [Leptospira borgpetersenii]UVD74783.1 hypothetical protein NU962_16695 [Leptospira borgpetersenii]UVD77968.1 hypothetical protein LIX27_16765 [Leptospira borgpetersenii]UZW34537.1 hypothetical protein OR565_16770 [Leptospira borgpetersenii]